MNRLRVGVRIRDNGRAVVGMDDGCGVRIGETVYKFDRVLGGEQSDVLDFVSPTVECFVDHGCESAIVAYGQTSSGKTYTMYGGEDCPGAAPQILSRMIERNGEVTVDAFELYLEHELDMLGGVEARVLDDKVIGLVKRTIKNSAQMVTLFDDITRCRKVSRTDMNERSSRSHAFLRVAHPTRASIYLTLVDLAGSERAGRTNAADRTLKEGAKINNSLMALSSVVSALSGGRKPTTFRNSKLTRVLRRALNGTSLFTILLCCSADERDLNETRQTLTFGLRVKNIKTRALVVSPAAAKTTTTTTSPLSLEAAASRVMRLEETNFYRDRVSAQEVEIRNLVKRNRLLRIENSVFLRRFAEAINLEDDTDSDDD